MSALQANPASKAPTAAQLQPTGGRMDISLDENLANLV